MVGLEAAQRCVYVSGWAAQFHGQHLVDLIRPPGRNQASGRHVADLLRSRKVTHPIWGVSYRSLEAA